ncbi:hypothetical protein TRICI_002542 [Trichomonascus ciferrii]|uniref:5'-3' exoribonuclease 1 n=1 Tax=Trichomonascus ciferrii TaxID=44093 RepID=A0A642VBG5_9ASCO|nr:hypothetical protein TRICI_002542 [Trichomonascus ciferrii]
MFVAIFNYIEHLFDLIRPQKMFFMAIDGVAPRAKMNQQRSRRFRTALDAEKARKKALDQGLELPTDDPFDSNAITPGTEFMAKLTSQLKYFINRKVSEDATWQGIDVILSGHEVPGEGEHKIMEQIRFDRAREDFDHNTRHCLYGLDADLIMLGLLSHDPHFALLREEVTFGRRDKKQKELTEQKFFLLHLSLVREYLELEFGDVKDEISFDFDFERVLDDFILINYFVGNDFLPELPSLLINEGALPTVFRTYKNALKQLDGYLTSKGVINFNRLGVWLDEMSKFELEKFEKGAIDAQWMNEDLDSVSLKSIDHPKLSLTPREKELLRLVKPFILSSHDAGKPEDGTKSPPSIVLPEWVADEALQFVRALAERTTCRVAQDGDNIVLIFDVDGVPDNENEDDESNRLLEVHRVLKKYENAPVEREEDKQHRKELYEEKFKKWKNKYYKDKFKTTLDDVDTIKDVAENYLEGLQWVYSYYFTGVASWGWFYRYHYAPCISDVKLGLKEKYDFTLGTPFRPFEQLMAVLPSRSKQLVPPAFRPLMYEETSPILDFYPHNFELDMNGKKNEWEAVVKIPFVEEKRLLSALATKEKYLTEEERRRNSFGKNLKFIFNPQVDYKYPSSLPGIFLDIPHSHCIEQELDHVDLNQDQVRFGLMENVKLGAEALAGFPSIKTIPHTHTLERAGVQVFQQPTRNESIIIALKNIFEDDTASSIAEKLLDESVFVGWPYLREAKVVAISDELFRYEKSQGTITSNPHPQKTLDDWKKRTSKFEEYFSRIGVRIGTVDIVVHVKKLKGLIRTRDGAYVKEFGLNEDEPEDDSYALQTLVEEVANEDERFKERESLPVSEEFPLDSKAVNLGPTGYGNPVTIIGHSVDKLDIKLMKLERPEPGFGIKAAIHERQSFRYYPSYEIAKMIKMHPLMLSKITSSFLVLVGNKKYDAGLSLKFEAKRLKVLGYSRRGQRGWEFTPQTIQLIQEYRQQFPDVCQALSEHSGSGLPQMDKLLDISQEKARGRMDELRRWIKSRTTDQPQFSSVSLESEGLTAETIKKIEQAIIPYFDAPEPVKSIVLKNIPRQALLAPSHAYHQLRSQRFSLGDRVVSALNFGKVRLFNRGTVVGINSETTKVTLDVLFDHEFDAGNTLNGRCETKRGLTVDVGSVVNLTNRQLVYQTKKSMAMKNTKAPNGKAPLPPKSVWNKSGQSSQGPVKGKVQIMQRPKENKLQASIQKNVPKPQQNPQSQPQQAQQPASGKSEENRAMSNELLAMLKGSGSEQQPAAENKDNEVVQDQDLSKKIQGKKNNAKVLDALYNAYMPQPPNGAPLPMPPQVGPPIPPPEIVGAVHGGFMAPPPPPNFVPQGYYPPPPPPQHYDMAGSADLMKQLHIGEQNGTQQHPDSSNNRSRGRGRGRGRGNNRGRGRGGRGRGN